MSLYNKKYLYSNGSSITAGGGFEEYEYRKDVRVAYFDKGITLPKTQLECSYPYHVAKNLGLELINDAKCGSGISRLVRKTFNWIHSNKDKIKETIILLEPQPGIRLDWYVKEWNDYGIVNAHLNENGEYPFTLVDTWFKDDNTEQIQWNEKHEKTISGYLNNFYDQDVWFKKELDELYLLITYLNYENITYFISYDIHYFETFKHGFDKLIPKHSNLYNKLKTNVWNYAVEQKMLIEDEVDSNDNHIGYEGNKIVANLISEYIKKPHSIVILRSKLEDTLDKMLRHSNLEIIDTEDIKECDLVFFDNLTNKFELKFPAGGSSFWETYKNNKEIKEKLILTMLFHEIHERGFFEQKKDFLNKTFGIDKSKCLNLDVGLSNLKGESNIPLEFKLKQYNFFDEVIKKDSTKDEEIENFRDKKFTFLNRKLTNGRFYTLKKILDSFENLDSLKNENVISNTDIEGFEKFIKDYKISNTYETANFPWVLEEDLHFDVTNNDINKLFNQIYIHYEKSIFSIINETTIQIDELARAIAHPEHSLLNRLYLEDQFSEKTLIPIMAGNLPFVIYDCIYYKNFESIGFDFSYLKDIFDIDYLNNTYLDNYNSIDSFCNVIKNNSISDLNNLRYEYKHIIKNNRDVLKEIMFGGLSKNEIDFFNKIKNETNTLH